MRDPKNSGNNGTQSAPFSPPPPSSQSSGKEPAQAFSNVTSPMSECSANDRPMSEGALQSEKSSPLPDSVKSAEASPTPPDYATSGERSPSSGTIKSTSVNPPQSKKSASSGSEESETEEEEETEESESEETYEDEDEEEKEPIKKPVARKLTPPPTGPGKLEHCDESTGAVTFWHNTAPTPKKINPSLFAASCRWAGVVVDEGTPAAWPPPEPPTDHLLGPVTAASPEYLRTVEQFINEAMDHPRIRVVQEHDRRWPDLAFARINDLDRALTDAASRLIAQATTLASAEQQTADVDSEERRVKKTNAFMTTVGEKGALIGQEFENVAQNFAEIAYFLDSVHKMTESPEHASPSTRVDLQNMKLELQGQCQELKARLIGLKGEISDYSFTISSHIQDVKNEDKAGSAPRKLDDDDDEADSRVHRAAYQCIKELKQDIQADSSIDKTGVFQRWHEQSRLRRLLDSMEKRASQGVRDADMVDHVKLMKPPAPFVDLRALEKPAFTLKSGQFGKMEYAGAGGIRRDEMDERKTPLPLDEDDNFDFYSVPEGNPATQTARSVALVGVDSGKPKSKESKGSRSKLDFYTAPEPKSDI